MDQKEQIEALTSMVSLNIVKVDKIYDAIFGVENRGGLYKLVEDHEAELKKLIEHKNRIIGGIAMLSIVCGAVGGIIGKFIK